MNPYSDENIAVEYLKFLDSDNGKIQQEVLFDAIARRLGNDTVQKILDAACGNGWLTGRLSKKYKTIEGLDSSAELIARAKNDHPGLEFKVADLAHPLPYPPASFDSVILNMAVLDIEDTGGALKNINATLKPHGELIMTLPNPYYNYPVGVWKAGFGKLVGKKPSLRLNRPYFGANANKKSPTWGKAATSYTKPLASYINGALSAGFDLNYFEDIISPEDSKKFDLKYQMQRFPLVLLLEFKKRGE